MLDAVPPFDEPRDEAGRTVLSHSEFTARDPSPPTSSPLTDPCVLSLTTRYHERICCVMGDAIVAIR